jgi:hypothetical protein
MKPEQCLEELKKAEREIYDPDQDLINFPDINFDLNDLHDSKFKNMVTFYNNNCNSPLEYIITGLLCSLSGATGKYAYFNISDSIRIFLNIWAVMIGKSTIMKKSTAINETTFELSRLNYEFERLWNIEAQKYKSDKKGKKNELIPPRKYIILPSDSTVESLTEILSYSDRGLMTYGEFGAFLRRMSRKYNGDIKQFLTEIFDVPASYEASRVSSGSKLLYRPFISMIGASTMEWIRDNSEYNDLKSGFFARFLFTIKNTNEKPYIPILEVPGRITARDNAPHIYEYFKNLCNMNTPIILEVEKKAKDIHVDYDLREYNELLRSNDPNELSFKARLLIYSLKIAGIIAMTNGRTIINVNDIEDAIQLAEYYKKNIEQMLSLSAQNLEISDKEQKFLRIIRSRGGEISHSELLRYTHEEIKSFNMIIDTLLQKEMIEMILTQKDGYRQQKNYRLLNS